MANEPHNDDEARLFSRIHDSFDIRGSRLPDVQKYLSSSDGDSLLDSFFRPGATDDVFINYHPQFLNGWIHKHDFFELIYVARGQAVDWIDGIEVRLKTGELCIHNPNARHQILSTEPDDALVINVLLSPHIFQRAFRTMLMENEQLDQFFNYYLISGSATENHIAFTDTTSRADIIMELLVEEFLRHERASRFVMESTLVVLFAELVRNFEPDPFMRDLVTYVSDHLKTVSLKDAAGHFGYHRNYFPQVVRKHTARTFWEIVTNLRIQRASNLLLFSDTSVESIAHEVGYKSTASFYEHFYQAHGQRPAEYRCAHASAHEHLQ